MAVPMPLMFLGQDVRQFRVSQKASAGGQVALTVGGAVDGLVMAVVELLLEAPAVEMLASSVGKQGTWLGVAIKAAEEILASSVGKQGTWLGVAIKAAEEILASSVGKQGTWLGTALKAAGEILPFMMKTASQVEAVQVGGTPFVGLWRNACSSKKKNGVSSRFILFLFCASL